MHHSPSTCSMSQYGSTDCVLKTLWPDPCPGLCWYCAFLFFRKVLCIIQRSPPQRKKIICLSRRKLGQKEDLMAQQAAHLSPANSIETPIPIKGEIHTRLEHSLNSANRIEMYLLSCFFFSLKRKPLTALANKELSEGLQKGHGHSPPLFLLKRAKLELFYPYFLSLSTALQFPGSQVDDATRDPWVFHSASIIPLDFCFTSHSPGEKS